MIAEKQIVACYKCRIEIKIGEEYETTFKYGRGNSRKYYHTVCYQSLYHGYIFRERSTAIVRIEAIIIKEFISSKHTLDELAKLIFRLNKNPKKRGRNTTRLRKLKRSGI